MPLIMRIKYYKTKKSKVKLCKCEVKRTKRKKLYLAPLFFQGDIYILNNFK